MVLFRGQRCPVVPPSLVAGTVGLGLLGDFALFLHLAPFLGFPASPPPEHWSCPKPRHLVRLSLQPSTTRGHCRLSFVLPPAPRPGSRPSLETALHPRMEPRQTHCFLEPLSLVTGRTVALPGSRGYKPARRRLSGDEGWTEEAVWTDAKQAYKEGSAREGSLLGGRDGMGCPQEQSCADDLFSFP